MKATELRIGNYIVYNGGQPEDIDEFTIIEVQDIAWAQQKNEEFNKYHSPIPLTEEWLLKLGFNRVENGYYGNMSYNRPCWIKFSFTILIWDDGTFVYDWNGGNTILKNVNQLQNLYFALTGKERTIN